MASFFTTFLIGMSLSMDAFSLALAYGITGISKKEGLILSIIVGIFHFIMPIIGLTLGSIIENISFINLHIIAAIILMYIGIDLIITNKKENDNMILNKANIIMFALSVSIDSLTVGIGLKAIAVNYMLAPVVFSLCSAIFTYLGLILGNIIGQKIGLYSKIAGGIVLITIAIIMFLT